MTSGSDLRPQPGSTSPSVTGAVIPPPSLAATAQLVDEMIGRVRQLVGSPGAEAMPWPPLGPSLGEPGSMPASAGRQDLEEEVGRQPESPGATRPVRVQRQAIGYREFISAVQGVGALETDREAERAATATLGVLWGCLSCPAAQNMVAYLPRPVRKQLSRRPFTSSMCRFSPAAFVKRV